MQVINTNVMSLNAQRNLATNSSSLATSIQRLSSGLRINSAKDDAAGLAISERFSTQIRGLNVAVRNANDAISLAQTAEGAMGEISNNLQRIRELAVQSRNATNSVSDRAALDAEVQQLKSEIARVAGQTEFNGLKLLDGSFTTQAFQVGANQGQIISVDSIVNANIAQLGSWTSVGTAAVAAGVAPVGSGADPGQPATPNASAVSGNFTSVSLAQDSGHSYSLTVGGVTVISADANVGSGGAVTVNAAAIDTALGTQQVQDDLAAAGISVSGTAAAGTLAFTKADGTSFDIAVVNGSGAGGFAGADFATGTNTVDNGSVAVPPTAASFDAGSFEINGVTINVGAAANATARLNDLVSAINGSGAGVTASIVSGALSLTSNDATADLVIGNPSSGFDLAEQTGLTAGTENPVLGAAMTGFSALSIATADDADNAILAMDAALDAINSARADLGAVQNRFQSVIANLQTTSENLTASRSRIRDTDFAKETAELTRTQILQQAGTAMLAQANAAPQNVLTLLRG